MEKNERWFITTMQAIWKLKFSQIRCSVICLCSLFVLIGVGSVQATPIVIDAFGQTQDFSQTNVGTTTDTEVDADVAPDDMFGDEREVTIEITASQFGDFEASAEEAGGVMVLSNDAGVKSVMTFLWDDGLPGGGVDLTDSGMNTGLAIDVLFADAAIDLEFEITEFMGGTGSFSILVPANIIATQQLFFPFISFSGIIDFTDVLSVQLTINGPASWDATIDLIGATTPIPEPSTLALFVVGGIGMLGYAWRRRKQVS